MDSIEGRGTSAGVGDLADTWARVRRAALRNLTTRPGLPERAFAEGLRPLGRCAAAAALGALVSSGAAAREGSGGGARECCGLLSDTARCCEPPGAIWPAVVAPQRGGAV
eukprot:TRINITY_DN2451_c0_g1_i2.p3 TRINITY_DN2451_c0_g1~~TRINITY_DN2451_c0_g1_i2.p3  ORF type:complete len:110 (+),score=5.74 TRINITY_DN2451_c0_g1_i2:305-634(+)